MDNSKEQKTYRNTKQRCMILDCLKENVHAHTTAEDVYDLLKNNDNKVGRATVYRYLAQLESEGFVRKYSFIKKKGACFRYLGKESNCKDHYHLMCSICGTTKHFENSKLQGILGEINKKHDFLIDDTKTIFYGICERCKNEK